MGVAPGNDQSPFWRTLGSLPNLARANEWWEYKFVPALLVGYVTALYLGVGPWSAVIAFVALIAALLPGGIFVAFLNDLTDRRDDALAGKPNRQVGKHPAIAYAVMFLCLMVGGLFVWLWQDDVLLAGTYALGWVAFMLYSLPPIRLKSRGAGGLLCDAAGAHLVPALLAALLVFHTLGERADWTWLIIISLWSLSYGLRGIVWHQIGDVAADRLSNTGTFVARYGEILAARLIKWVAFPIEMLALGAAIMLAGPASISAAALALIVYARLIYRRIDQFDMTVTIVWPRIRNTIILQEFYDVLLPLALLLTSVVYGWQTLIILTVHCLCFPSGLRRIIDDFVKFSDPQYLRRSERHP